MVSLGGIMLIRYRRATPISSLVTVMTSSMTQERVSVGLRASAITANLVVLASSVSMVAPLLVETAVAAAAAAALIDVF
jgi:hypothetical protein